MILRTRHGSPTTNVPRSTGFDVRPRFLQGHDRAKTFPRIPDRGTHNTAQKATSLQRLFQAVPDFDARPQSLPGGDRGRRLVEYETVDSKTRHGRERHCDERSAHAVPGFDVCPRALQGGRPRRLVKPETVDTTLRHGRQRWMFHAVPRFDVQSPFTSDENVTLGKVSW